MAAPGTSHACASANALEEALMQRLPAYLQLQPGAITSGLPGVTPNMGFATVRESSNVNKEKKTNKGGEMKTEMKKK